MCDFFEPDDDDVTAGDDVVCEYCGEEYSGTDTPDGWYCWECSGMNYGYVTRDEFLEEN